MKDPCKAGKCLTYSICYNKTIIDCPILKQYITDCIKYFKQKNTSERGYKIKYRTDLWKHIETIFPKLNVVSHYKPSKHKEMSINPKLTRDPLKNIPFPDFKRAINERSM